MNSDVVIKNLIFDLELSSEQEFKDISDKLFDLLDKKLNNLIEEVFNNFNFPDNFKIDSLEINLEDFNIQEANDFLLFFKVKLTNELNKLVQKNLFISEKSENLLLFYAQKGILPWWASKDKAINNYVANFNFDIEVTNQVLSSFFKNKNHFNRLINSLSEKNKAKLIKGLLKTQFNFFKNTIEFVKLLDDITCDLNSIAALFLIIVF